MRTLPVTVVISTVVHIAVVAAWLVLEEKPLARRLVTVPSPMIEPELVVELVDRPSSGPPGGSRIASTPRTRGATPPEVAPLPDRAPVAPRPGATLAMRGRPELPTLPQGLSDELVAKPPVPVPDLPGARLDVEIAAIHGRLKNAGYVANATPEQIASDRLGLAALREARKDVELVRQRDGSYRTEKDRFIARVDPDGKVHLKDTPNLEVQFGILSIAGRFDVTDWAMRSRGMDPYASEKLRFLDRTRDQRVAIGQEHRRAQLAQSDVAMRRNIDRLWASTTELAARKQGLFELWDDCAESGDAALIAGGTAARTVVTNFIQIKLRDADAFTAAEIAQLNAMRRSKTMFAPYD